VQIKYKNGKITQWRDTRTNIGFELKLASYYTQYREGNHIRNIVIKEI